MEDLELENVRELAASLVASIKHHMGLLESYLDDFDPSDRPFIEPICKRIQEDNAALTDLKTLLGSLYKERVLDHVTIH